MYCAYRTLHTVLYIQYSTTVTSGFLCRVRSTLQVQYVLHILAFLPVDDNVVGLRYSDRSKREPVEANMDSRAEANLSSFPFSA